MRWLSAVARSELFDIKGLLRARRLKFNPDQPRVPAGQREGGQWMSLDGGAGATNNSRRVDVSIGSFGSTAAQDIQRVASKKAVTLDYSRALTGISTIDNATKALSESLAQTMVKVDFIPEWTPAVYGTAVHVDFGNRVRYQGIPGIGPDDVEQSFFNRNEAGYGDSGSIRTDVILRNDIGDVIAIYDVKTGGATLSAARVRELRDHTGVGIHVPIIELQVNRGATIKSIAGRPIIGVIRASLWNPMHLGNLGPAAGS